MRKMFGGLAFLINGHMAVVVSSQGGVMIRVERDRGDELVATTPARLAEMRGQVMRGWLRIDETQLADRATLQQWVDLGVAFAGSLPPKE